MINKLVLVRHGDAEFYGPEGTDESRRLTKHGRKALRRAYPSVFARLADEDGLNVWVSPAVRAVQTAEVVADALDIDPDTFDVHDSLYVQDDDEFLAELEAEGEGVVIAVGHVPFMQRMLYKLTGTDVSFTKGSVAAISFEGGDLRKGTLDWFAEGPDA